MWPDDDRAAALLGAYRGAVRAFFVAQANRTLLETQLGAGLAHAEHVWNPYAVDPAQAPEWPDEADGLRLACVARLHPKSKGQDLLLLALAGDAWRSRRLEVSFFGQGDSAQSLQRLAQHLGLGGRVHFRGHVADMRAVWARHHALVLPSRYEGLPISLVEAMLSRRPAIVTDVGGNAEVVEDGTTGFVARAPTRDAVAEALERAWHARSRWRAMGEAAAAALSSRLPAQPADAFAARLVEIAGACATLSAASASPPRLPGSADARG
jgi:glycosyltransferase involved in cell wall biosynthesis